MVRRFLALLSAALLGLIGVALGAAPAQAASDAHVSVLHAVPGATVDVYVNGDRLLKNFKPGTLTEPQRSRPARTTSRS